MPSRDGIECNYIASHCIVRYMHYICAGREHFFFLSVQGENIFIFSFFFQGEDRRMAIGNGEMSAIAAQAAKGAKASGLRAARALRPQLST